MIHVHDLNGCAPAPLAHYLKALGIFRLVSEQVDDEARGWWQGDRFCLATALNRNELEGFFLRTYEPTAFVSPWSKDSGFFNGDEFLTPLKESKSPRFANFRAGIEASVSSPSYRKLRDQHKKPDEQFKRTKQEQIPIIRKNWRGGHREWMDAAMVLLDNNSPEYPALFGSGGNDGRLEFTRNFMRLVGMVYDLTSAEGAPRSESFAWLSGALWGTPISGLQNKLPIGQYLPATAGGANNANGPSSDSMINPVDFILLFEGAIVFTSHATRKFSSSDPSRIASPFVVKSRGSAYASASVNDESPRGEQWMPLWSQPTSYAELKRILSEGRAQVGTGRVAREPLDIARAAKRLGTARGIVAFQRYGYIKRNGRSNLAVPLGRFAVTDEKPSFLACLDDLDLWLARLRKATRKEKAPGELVGAERCLSDALFAVTEAPHKEECWQQVLLYLGELEKIMVRSGVATAVPIPKLRPEWVFASNDDTPEFRLALALALTLQDSSPRFSVRHHWLPLDETSSRTFATTGSPTELMITNSTRVVMHGRSGLDDAIALVQRCLVDASQGDRRYWPLIAGSSDTAASAADLTNLLAGNIDMDRTLSLACALMALDRKKLTKQYIPKKPPMLEDWPDDAWLAVRLCLLPWKLVTRTGFELDVGTDPALVRLLAAGNAASAVTIALRRLRAAGVQCTLRTGTTTAHTARLWAAALAFPIARATAGQLFIRFDPSKEQS